MWRAIRLVVDTGVHSQHWTRQQMVDYFHEHSTMDETTMQSEMDRYIGWPAQALAYKMGQMKILELRARAQEALGAKFDIKAFHDEVLDSGALPMDVLEKRVDAWIAETATKHGVSPFTEISDWSTTDVPNCSTPACACDGSNKVSTCVEALKLSDAIEVPCTTIESPAMTSPIVAANPPSVPIVNTPGAVGEVHRLRRNHAADVHREIALAVDLQRAGAGDDRRAQRLGAARGEQRAGVGNGDAGGDRTLAPGAAGVVHHARIDGAAELVQHAIGADVEVAGSVQRRVVAQRQNKEPRVRHKNAGG